MKKQPSHHIREIYSQLNDLNKEIIVLKSLIEKIDLKLDILELLNNLNKREIVNSSE